MESSCSSHVVVPRRAPNASFVLPPTFKEMLYPPSIDNNDTLCVWAFSRRRTLWETVRAFLNVGYNYRHSRRHPQYHMEVVAYSGIVVRFINPQDAHLLYGCCYHCGCELIAFTRANPFTNYDDQFPRVRIHQLR